MKWQTKQANPPTSILSKVEKIHNDQITKETPTTKYQETHTKANNGVGRPKGEHSKIDNLTKTTCSNVTQHKKDASSIAFCGQRICTRVNTHTHFGGLSFVATYKRWNLAPLVSFLFSFFFDFCFLTMIPSLLLVPSSLTIHTRQYLKTNTHTCNASQYHRASPIG